MRLHFQKRSIYILLSLGLIWSNLSLNAYSQTSNQNTNPSELSASPEQNFKQGQITLAVQKWSRDIQQNKNIDNALYNRSQAYILLKQYPFAIKDLDKLLTIQGKKVSVNVYILRGIALAESSQLPAAIESFNQAEKLQPSPLVYNNRALAYQNLGQLNLALEDLQKSVKLAPIPPHRLNLANVQIQLGQYQQAVQAMTQTLFQDSTFYPAYTTRGIGYFNLGLFESAIQDFVQALKLQPDQPEAFYYAGLAFNKLNRKQDATQNLLRAADLYLQKNQSTLYQQVLDKMTELRLQ
jgi:tetratricopeptide (TPR) repeat protein